MRRFVGIDVGAETIKVVELTEEGGDLRWTRRALAPHREQPGGALVELLSDWGWDDVTGAAACGRFGRLLTVPRVPTRDAQATAHRFLHGEGPATLISIGSHGFSVLELRPSGTEVFRESSRCSQGTGNFLRQLVERFGLSVAEASALAEGVDDPAPLSGRCPVILKTDMTHLANKGEQQDRILAGLLDAVCENVMVLVQPRLSPSPVRLLGGVSRSGRVRRTFARHLEAAGLELDAADGDDDAFLYYGALGSARRAAELEVTVPSLDDLVAPPAAHDLERVPRLAQFLDRVERRPAPPAPSLDGVRRLVLGFDMGSTGSKAVALDPETEVAVWEGYLRTEGRPVQAAQSLMRRFSESPAAALPVVGCGVTGSGREIVGSLLATCYGPETVYVQNEIAAHAEGALHADPEVDTIFEIGGQDAKYIRLAGGRVIDAAMNEACSAGTGSFIEEQGLKLAGGLDVVELGQAALAADHGVSLGQHCSVFMAEVIGEAVAAGVGEEPVIAGIYDSVVQNYLNRVKGSRSVGQVIFCQGMPFASDALAAAVARRTGARIVIPPNPGNVGALGIALLAREAIALDEREPVDPERFLGAEVVAKETFVCQATRGCGGAGNRCRIDRLRTRVAGKQQRFTWGGGCSLWDRGTGKQKLPDRTPDPFRERRELIEALAARLSTARPGRKRVALSEEFVLKGLFPFFATYLHALDLDLIVHTGGDQAALKRGIEEANVGFCAPMQLYHGLVAAMAEERPDYLFLPLLRDLPKVAGEPRSAVCPIVQASPDVLRWDLPDAVRGSILAPRIDVGGDLRSATFQESCKRLAGSLGLRARRRWRRAFRAALAAQEAFDSARLDLGRRALDFARERGLNAVVVLGRPYTIHNTVLNSNVPALLREQGAVAVPIDCFPVADGVPAFASMYWAHGQRNLRAVQQIRATPGVYAIWCSNYACGPDSFNLHYYAHLMEGKPFCVIETDGHSGDAGTKTRVEAFLHCVRQEQRERPAAAACADPAPARTIDVESVGLPEVRAEGLRVLFPRMGPGTDVLVACLRGIGVEAESLPQPDRDALGRGRRYTSGKECLPLTVTLGSLLQRLEREPDPTRRFAFFMPTTVGSCRFGSYHVLQGLITRRLGLADRVRMWVPEESSPFRGAPGGFNAVMFTGAAVHDALLEGLYTVRPAERIPGSADAVYRWTKAELVARIEALAGAARRRDALLAAAGGELFGLADLLRQAGRAFASIPVRDDVPTVLVSGEAYVRADPFCNDFVIERLEERGVRVRFAHLSEWFEYSGDQNTARRGRADVGAQLFNAIQRRYVDRAFGVMLRALGQSERTGARQFVEAATRYLDPAVQNEAVLTVGAAVHDWRAKHIDGVISVGPLECMPAKVAEAQLFHVAEQEGLATLSLSFNGDPIDPQLLDDFAYEVHARVRRRRAKRRPLPVAGEALVGAPG